MTSSESQRHSPAERRTFLVAAGVVSALFTTWAWTFIRKSSFVAVDKERYHCLFDDAMISMRYAWNVSHGNGLAWNPGDRVEGITNLLWTLVMAVPTGLLDKSDAVFTVQLLGLGLLLAAAGLAVAITRALVSRPEHRALASNPFVAVLVLAFSLAYYPANFWGLMGMETAFLSVLLSAAVLLVLHSSGEARVRPSIGILLGLTLATRPESLIVVSLVLLFRAWRGFGKRGGLKAVVLEGGIVGLFGVAILLFRYFYYGSVIPNTYRLKMTGLTVAERLSDGVEFVTPYLSQTAPLWVLAAAGVVLLRSRAVLLPAGLAVSALLVQVWVGGDAWPYWRMMTPFYPMTLALAVIGLVGWLERLAGRVRLGGPGSRTRLGVAAVATLALAAILYRANGPFLEEAKFERRAYFVDYNEKNVNLSLVLREVLRPEATIGVTWGGTVPYYSGFKAVDFLGKNDAHVAGLERDRESRASIPGHDKYNLEYSIGVLRPTYVQNTRWGAQRVSREVRRRYVERRYRGVRLLLLRDSEDVHWEKLAPGRRKRAARSD